jgi:NAD(P)-dependent dehydrogenase (short-subunit alcohol dehydrogenase family)
MAPAGGIDYPSLTTGGLKPTTEYGQSKWGNIALAKALHERYPDVVSASVHPGEPVYNPSLTSGMVASNLTAHFSATDVVLTYLPWLVVGSHVCAVGSLSLS